MAVAINLMSEIDALQPPVKHKESVAFQPSSENVRAYRDALGQFATGVTVVTINALGGPMGMTVNSFASVSLDPALVLWSVEKTSGRSQSFLAAQHYAIHVMRQNQRELALKFARNADVFDACHWKLGNHGVPLIQDALACFECEVEAQHDAGDHVIIVGRVVGVTKAVGKPLIFAGGEFGGFDQF